MTRTINHPKYRQLCATIDDEKQRQMIFEVYMDLSEVRKWHNLNIRKLKANRFVVTGNPMASAAENAVYPVSSQDKFSLGEITDLLSSMKEELQSPILILAFIDQDSTIAYSKLQNGLNPPETPRQMQDKRKWAKHKFARRKNKFT
ncbi:DgyrCDS6885 [Dimorphilus gyrociliatus]|uniref:DgyrCDS6885 n=1 Tax=Dimorphilus gyrociliatus TaxID=2664684 RepID=A0A7I8VPZ4_9ANNE|nr:DgyrCDS6885 [Dimorphilus gyrociliatus]